MKNISDFWRGGPKVTTPNFDNMPFIAGIAAASAKRKEQERKRLDADAIPAPGGVTSSRSEFTSYSTMSFAFDPGYDLGQTFLWRPRGAGNSYVESPEETQARQRAEAKKLEPPARPDLRKRFVRE